MSTVRQQITSVTVLDSDMEVYVYAPEHAARVPGLILAQHIPVGHAGLENDTFTLRAAERFAAAGYKVAVPFLFHWWPKRAPLERKRAEARDDWMVEDVRAAFELLRSDGAVESSRIGMVGHCWGGRVAWLAACHLPTLAACAVFYGGRIKLPMGPDAVPPIELAGNIRCPLMGFFGNDDTNPTPADVDDYAEALTRAGVTFTFHRYDGAGHAFQNFPSPERYREDASEDAWTRVLEFFRQTLQG